MFVLPMMMGAFRPDQTITKQKLKPGTVRQIVRYARPYRVPLMLFLLFTMIDAVLTVVDPLLLRMIIDEGIVPRDEGVVVLVALVAVAVAVFGAVVTFVIRWFSAWIGRT